MGRGAAGSAETLVTDAVMVEFVQTGPFLGFSLKLLSEVVNAVLIRKKN